MSNANLNFLAWVRQGAATAIKVDETLGATQAASAKVSPALMLNGAPLNTLPAVRLRGPGDVVGLDANQVVRTDPRPGTSDFEPNCFPSIEFDRPDFPWLFTPARANASMQLRPWVCLVVVRKQDGVALANGGNAPLPTLNIAGAEVPSELPNLNDVWAWAHAQVAADDDSAPTLRAALTGASSLSLSRLVCPRVLAPNTDYLACVVPTFELGRKAGLGLPISDAELNGNTLAPAWSSLPKPPATVPDAVTLPVYFHWEFRTGEAGDFESLARRLKPGVPGGLGKQTIDISQPGFPLPGATTVDMEGALLPIASSGTTPPPPDPVYQAFQTALAPIVSVPDQAPDASADPVVAPPLYGRWFAGRSQVAPGGATWLEQLNLDPRWRVAAAFGTRVVQEHQEALMASAWEQAAELPAANQRMRQLQLSMAVGEVLHARHFSQLSEEKVLRIAAPAFGRLRQVTGQSLLAQQAGSQLPVGANRSAMRRIGRLRGPLSRRTAAQRTTRTEENSWVARLNGIAETPGVAVPSPPASDWAAIPDVPSLHLSDASNFGVFTVAPENAPVTPPGAPVNLPTTEFPGFFRKAAIDHVTRIFYRRVINNPHFVIFQDIKAQVVEQTHPRTALPQLVDAILTTGDQVLAPTAPGVPPVGTESVMAAPSFPQPMYETLRDISQDLFLPGLDKVKPDTILGLSTNRHFVEAFMVGLNHEMGRELLWRGYPTDQRGTCFSHFWGMGVPNAAPPDITPLNTWGTRALGSPVGGPDAEEFVMLIRGSLLRRYPNAAIFLTPALNIGQPDGPVLLVPDENPQAEVMPIFSGAMEPDVCFFGFPVATDDAIGKAPNHGYYLVIQEHPTEPRFGLDASLSLGNSSHLAIGSGPPTGLQVPPGRTWGRNAAEMAAITRRLPVRIAIHASRLITAA